MSRLAQARFRKDLNEVSTVFVGGKRKGELGVKGEIFAGLPGRSVIKSWLLIKRVGDRAVSPRGAWRR